jgi:GT2 family glycosyltransferase
MYGQAAYTRKCIDLTLKNAGVPIDVLVVDDGSPEAFYAVEEYEGANVQVLRLFENTGYTNATNQGILWAQKRDYDFVHLLNNDTEPYPDFIKHLVEAMKDDVAVASSVRLYPKEDLVELYGIDLLRGYQAVTKMPNLKDEVVECNWVPLCSALVRMDVVREVGLLDKAMRTHSSDLDYCLRIKIAHHRIIVVTNSRVIHHHEVTTKACGITPERDQMALLEKLAGLHYAQFMARIPLDCEGQTYGQLRFEVIKK